MAFSNTTNRTSATGSGVIGQAVPFSFPVSDSSEIICYSRITATGVEATLMLTTNYTVAITGDTGGTVTTVTAIATTSQIHIVRATAKTQTFDLEHGGTFSAENIEDALDKQTRIAIDAIGKANRSLVYPETDPTTSIVTLASSIDRRGKVLYFDASTGAPTVAAITAISPTDLTGAVQLLSSTTVSFAADADTTVYTVPDATRLVLDHLMVVAAADAGATTTISCGQDGAETDFVYATELLNLDAQYDAVIIYPPAGMVPSKVKSYAAGTVIQVQVATQSGSAGNTVYLYGTLYAV